MGPPLGGYATADEGADPVGAAFELIDRNGGGTLSRAEVRTALRAAAARGREVSRAALRGGTLRVRRSNEVQQ
jgi:hypothetical protein